MYHANGICSAGDVLFLANRISVPLLLFAIAASISHVILKGKKNPFVYTIYKFNIEFKPKDNNSGASFVAVNTIDRNQKISSGQFNSNLNPIKDLVTNPRSTHTHKHTHSPYIRTIERTLQTPFVRIYLRHTCLPNSMPTIYLQESAMFSSTSSLWAAHFRVIILLQGIKIRQRSSNMMDFKNLIPLWWCFYVLNVRFCEHTQNPWQ